jgi:uncharacterized protein YxjI
MQFPISLRFKIFALAPQIFVDDAAGQSICYVKQKLFRFREKVELHQDSSMQKQVATIEADRIIDWSAKYTFKDMQGQVLGAVGRRGLRSLWSAHYDVFAPTGDQPVFHIREENPFAKIIDSFLGEIPIIGAFTGYFIHPKYLASRADGTPVMRLTKKASLLERRFTIDQIGEAAEGEQAAIMMSFLMMILLERARG